jgi:hypothetical protein
MEPDKDSDQYPAAEMVGYSYESWRTWIAWRKAARVRLEADELVVRIEGAPPYHIALGSIRGVQLHRPFLRALRRSDEPLQPGQVAAPLR